jgi:hypothetical protein
MTDPLLIENSRPFRAYGRCTRLPTASVYHYTDRAGLVGILNSAELRATKFSYLNDSREISHGRELVRRKVLEFIARHDREPVGAVMRDVWAMVDQIPVIPVFVACFCEDGDALSQWRAYAPRGGYAIGIPPRGIVSISTSEGRGSGMIFGPVVYNPVEQDSIVDELLAEVAEGIRKPGWNETSARWLAGRLSVGTTLVSAHMKHHRFSEEREWRFVVTPALPPNPLIQYRAGQTLLTPYVAIPLDADNSVINDLELIAGPSPHPQLALEAGIELVKSKEKRPGLRPDAIRFRNSEIPYRDW